MESRRYLRNLASSPLGIATVVASASAGLGVGLLAAPAAGLVAGAAALALLTALATVSGLGPKAAAAERERRAWAGSRARLDAAREARNTLATLRVPNPEIKALLELAATRGTAYLAACESARSRDPLAEEALAECVSLADLYLKEIDGAATERRYGLEDADPFADANARIIAALLARAAVIEKATLDLSGGLSSADRMEIKETL